MKNNVFTTEERIVKLQNATAKLQNSKNLISNNKGIVATKNENNVSDSKSVVSALKQALNCMCGAKRFSGLSFSKETAIWLVENRMTADERRLLFNKLNKVDYEKLIAAITRKQREFAKEVGANKALAGKLGKEYCAIFDNMCIRYMA